MIPSGRWRRVFATRIAWYVACFAAPTLALTVGLERPFALALIALAVLTLAVVTFAPPRVRRLALPTIALAALAAIVAWARSTRAS